MADQEMQDIASDDGVTLLEPKAFLVPDFPAFGFEIRSAKTDLVLYVEDYRLFATKSHLQFNSPVFENILEKSLGETVVIEDVKGADFAEFLACIQPRNRNKISNDNVFRMVELAKKYEVEDLIERCEYCLLEMLRQQTKPTGIKTITLYLDLAFKYDLKTLKSECLKISAEVDEGSMCDRKALKGMRPEARCELYETWLPRLTTKARLADILLMSLKREERLHISGISESKRLIKISCTSKKECQTYSFNKWGINWVLNIMFPSTGETVRRFISIQCIKESKDFKSLIMVSAVVPNHIAWNEDKSYVQLVRFDSSKSCGIISPKSMVYLEEVNFDDESLGFKLKGKLTLNVQLLFSKPVYHG